MAYPPFKFATQGNPALAPPSGPTTPASQLDANFAATAALDFSNVANAVKIALPLTTATTAAIGAAIGALAPVAVSGSYNDLTGKPTLGTAAAQNVAFFAQAANNLSDLASVATARNNLGLGTAAVQSTAFFAQVANNLSDLANAGTALTNLGLSANGKSLVTAADYAAMRILLSLVPGTNVQGFNANLAAIAGVTGAANTIFVFSGPGAGAVASFTALAQAQAAVTTQTAHGVLVGNGSAAANVTTAGTAGQALVSGGASTDPAFGVAGVNGGGTGAATLAAHGVVLGNGASVVTVLTPGASGTVLTSNGASADPSYQLPGAAAIQALWVRQVKATNVVPGDTPVAATWVQRQLDATAFNSITGASVTSNQVTLPTGTYSYSLITAAGSTTSGSVRSLNRLYDITNAVALGQSSMVRVMSDTGVAGSANISSQGVFTIAGPTVVEVEQYSTNAGTGPFGVPLNSGGNSEVYVDLKIEKLA